VRPRATGTLECSASSRLVLPKSEPECCPDPRDPTTIKSTEFGAAIIRSRVEHGLILSRASRRTLMVVELAQSSWSSTTPDGVRNSVTDRFHIVRLEIPCELVNRPGRGYLLTLRNED
jgi:hypothetical protein